MSDATHIVHLKGTETPLRVILLRDGDALDLSGYTLFAGLEKEGKQGSASFYRAFSLATTTTAGMVSGTIPTLVGWTGPSTLRVFHSAAPRIFLAPPIKVRVEDAGANFVPTA